MPVVGRIHKDEKHVQAIQDAVLAMTNPFDVTNTNLVSLSSGAVADDATKKDLLTAWDIGEEKLREFKQTRVVQQDADFFSTIKSLKLKTFATATRVQTKKAELQSVRSDRSLFIQLLLVAKDRDIDLRDILCYTLSPVPGCLSSTDKTAISKTNYQVSTTQAS